MIAARAKEVKEHSTAQAEHDADSRAKGITPTQLLFKSKLDFDYEPDDSDFYDSDTEDTDFDDEDDSDAYSTASSSSSSGISSSARRINNSRRSSSSSRSVSNSKNDYFSGYDDTDIGDVVVDEKFMVSKQKSGRVVVRLC
jgi:hypothetical protein